MQTVDQFFALKVPMGSGELSGLCRGIDNAFQVYTNLIVGNLGKYTCILYSVFPYLSLHVPFSMALEC